MPRPRKVPRRDTVDDLLRLDSAAGFAQANQPDVSMGDVDGTPSGTVVVLERIGNIDVERQGDFVDFCIGYFRGGRPL